MAPNLILHREVDHSKHDGQNIKKHSHKANISLRKTQSIEITHIKTETNLKILHALLKGLKVNINLYSNPVWI